jgi:tRNA pseudouridine38-40 synthase
VDIEENPYSINRLRIEVDKENLGNHYSYRISGERLEYLMKLLSKFNGTKDFHNYTKEKKGIQEGSEKRYIMDIMVSPESSIYKNVEFLKISIKGQSFLYNQIRKMISAVFLVMQYGIDEKFIDKSFEEDYINLPNVPSEGLLLEKVGFDQYNQVILPQLENNTVIC